MHKSKPRFARAIGLLLLIMAGARAEWITIESPHFRVIYQMKSAVYEYKSQQMAGEILEIAESVWPTLAKAYESYEHYQRIDIIILDDSDQANGFAIYPWSQVAIFAPHMDWVLRNRQIWLRNVVTHELAHVFTLRRAARLSPFDWVDLSGHTYNAKDRINFSFSVPWVPLIAPNWYIEGIAQFEAEQNGNDEYDSQRDMLLRDAYLTGTLPTLEYIETFDYEEPWIQRERVYNTGYAFLRYLRDRFGADKVRRLAFHKPLFNFSSSAEAAFGQSLPDLFEAFKRSLDEKYADFKDLPVDPVADPDMPGDYQQNLVFSSDGKYMAWLGNEDDSSIPANWIFWKPVKSDGGIRKSGSPTTPSPSVAPPDRVEEPGPSPSPAPEPMPEPDPQGMAPGTASPRAFPGFPMFRSPNPSLDLGRRRLIPGRAGARALSPSRAARRNHGSERSEELGSEGLEFNRDNTRLLTTRQDPDYAAYTDLWEYEFLADKDEDEKWHRLTWEERASYPSYHPFQRKIVFVRKRYGSTNLAVLDSTGRIGQLTNFTDGQQVYNPRYTPSGDSIYFTLQVGEKEAIAAVSAAAQAYDPFLALRDSALFPDSTNLARDQKLVLITPLKSGGIRNIRFSGDTLLWSSNMQDTGLSVYNVYARLPGDSAIHRATRARTQALEPLVHDGTLYYQGLRRQRFLIFRTPLTLTPTGETLAPVADSIPLAQPKRLNYSKTFETGTYSSSRVAHEIIPFLSVQPQFLDDDRTFTDLALGLAVNIGGPMGDWIQSFSGAVAKRADLSTPLNYQLSYAGYLSAGPIRHSRAAWTPALQYSLYHDIYQYEDVFRDEGGFFQGVDSVSVRARTQVSTVARRDVANAVFMLPYDFFLDGRFFRQRISQDFSQEVVFTNTGSGEVLRQAVPKTNYLTDAPQHRHFSAGLNWSFTHLKPGTYLPTGAGFWLSGRKWWATYNDGFMDADSLLIQELSQQGEPSPQLVLLQSRFNPWSLDFGAAGVWSRGRAFSLFANAEAGAFLNKFPTEPRAADISGSDTLVREETASSLWIMNYQLGYSRMPGYPYNFMYRGRDIMEGSAFTHGQFGIDVPIRALGAFIPGFPLSSFRQFSISGVANAGTTLITPADKILSALDAGRHHLLLDFGVRLAANFRIYHQYPFTLYVQGFQPYNRLKASSLMSQDYGRSAPRAGETPAQHDARDRDAHIRLVKEPRFFVGFQMGY